MAESSYFWEGAVTGDASLAPYDMDEFMAQFYRIAFLKDPDRQGPIDGYANSLAPSNPSGTTVRMASGAALVYGFLYENDANVDFSAAVAGYYRLILRCSWGAPNQYTVRADLLGPNGAVLPPLTQTPGVTYEINLCDIISNGAALTTFTDRRTFCRPNSYRMPHMRTRYGDDASLDWTASAAVSMPIMVMHTAQILCGSINWTGVAASSGSIAVTLPVVGPQAFRQPPIAIVNCPSNTTDILFSVETTTTTITIYWRTRAGGNETTLDFWWMAIGPHQRGV